jgi:hypothetical protein
MAEHRAEERGSSAEQIERWVTRRGERLLGLVNELREGIRKRSARGCGVILGVLEIRAKAVEA